MCLMFEFVILDCVLGERFGYGFRCFDYFTRGLVVYLTLSLGLLCLLYMVLFI